MIKSYLRSTLKNTLAAVDKVGKYHDTYLDHILEACINSVYYQVHAQNPRALGQYTKRYTGLTLAAGSFGRSECSLAVTLVPLPDKRGGARNIVCDADMDVYFTPVTDQEFSLLWEAQGYSLTKTTPIVVYFTPRPTKVEFLGTSTPTLFNSTYSMDLLVAFTSLVDTDEVPLPFGKNAEIIKMALEIIGVVPPKDLLDNNSDLK